MKTNDFSHGILATREKVVDDRLADYADFGGGLDVLFGEHVAVAHLVTADFQIVRADTVDGGRGVVGAVDGLSAAVDRR